METLESSILIPQGKKKKKKETKQNKTKISYGWGVSVLSPFCVIYLVEKT